MTRTHTMIIEQSVTEWSTLCRHDTAAAQSKVSLTRSSKAVTVAIAIAWQIDPELRLTGLCAITFAPIVYILWHVQRWGTDLIPCPTIRTHAVLAPLGTALVIAISHNIGALIATSNVMAAVIFQTRQRIASAHTCNKSNVHLHARHYTETHMYIQMKAIFSGSLPQSSTLHLTSVRVWNNALCRSTHVFSFIVHIYYWHSDIWVHIIYYICVCLCVFKCAWMYWSLGHL